MITETLRLRLRHFEPEDSSPLSLILAGPTVMRYSVSGPKTQAQTRRLIDACRADNAAIVGYYERLGFAVEDRVSLGKRL